MLSYRHFLAAAVLAVLLIPAALDAQTKPAAEKAVAAPAAPYKVPRTAWGDPDLQGMWTQFGVPDMEADEPDPVIRAAQEKAIATRYGPTASADGRRAGSPFGGASNEVGRPRSPKLGEYLVVDQPDNRIPTLPGKRVFWNWFARGDSWTNHGKWERCMTKGIPEAYIIAGYSSGFQILQSPGVVSMLPEMIHDARFVYTDGRPALGESIRQWNGDPRGHWDGDTLVIETKNFNDKGQVLAGAELYIYQSDALKVTERWKRVDAKTIHHEIRVEDPKTFSRPWTMRLAHTLDSGYVMYEYACHESNYDYMTGSLTQGRLRDQQAAAKKSSN